jgi:hypothetical protein
MDSEKVNDFKLFQTKIIKIVKNKILVFLDFSFFLFNSSTDCCGWLRALGMWGGLGKKCWNKINLKNVKIL